MRPTSLADQAKRAARQGSIISTIAGRLSRELDSMKEILERVADSEVIDLIGAEASPNLQIIRGLMMVVS